jgi:hypothetical protein
MTMYTKSSIFLIALSLADGFRIPTSSRMENAPRSLCMTTPDKTYIASPLKDMIDEEGAMSAFFGSKEDWSPLFRSIAADATVPALAFLVGEDTTWDTTPFMQLPAIPTDEADRGVLASFLDAMQQSLLDIPVDEAVQEDDGDLQFIEEGRRLLVVGRFQVLRGVRGGSVGGFDSLFTTCWSELAELSRSNQPNTGSLIVLPDYDMSDLHRFTDMNLRLPLEWLGLDRVFEVASLERGSPAIRLIYKLMDVPDEPWNEPDSEELPPNLQ